MTSNKDDELIRRGDVLKLVELGEDWWGAYAAIAALPAVLPVVTVKPLAWVDAPDGPDEWVAWCNVAQDYHGAGSLSQRAQVESDRAARILAELVVQPAPDATPLSPTAVDANPAPDTDAKVAALVDALREARDAAHDLAHDSYDGVWNDADFAGLTPKADAALAAWEGRGNE
jgi:hypothetical protein